MQAFTDLVGTTAVPAHAFDIAELTDLTPALVTATAVHYMAAQASEAITRVPACFDSTELTDLTPALDPATAVHDMAAQASEALPSLGTTWRGCC